jgi:hypothetical protein
MSRRSKIENNRNVGAPTFPNWNAGARTSRISVAQAFRPEAFSRGATGVCGTEITLRNGVVVLRTKTLTPERGQLQKQTVQTQIRHGAGVGRNVGVPTFSALLSTVRP